MIIQHLHCADLNPRRFVGRATPSPAMPGKKRQHEQAESKEQAPRSSLADATVNKTYLAEISAALKTIRAHPTFKDIGTADAIGISKDNNKASGGFKDLCLDKNANLEFRIYPSPPFANTCIHPSPPSPPSHIYAPIGYNLPRAIARIV